MEDCIFCKIVRGEIPSSKVYEDDNVIAFLDISPVNKGHTLVIPKKHSENILEDDFEDVIACMEAIRKIAPKVMESVNADGFNLSVNTNKAAGQEVMHTHFHIIPRFNDDEFKNWAQGQYEDGEMKDVQDKIKEKF